jgi:hypothetical protein
LGLSRTGHGFFLVGSRGAKYAAGQIGGHS